MIRSIFLQHPFFDSGSGDGSGGGAAAPAAAAAEPEVTPEQAIKVLQGSDDYVVMSASDYKNKQQQIRREEATNVVGKTHGIYDKLFSELSDGLEKDPEEKTVDYAKRVIQTLQEKAQGEPNEIITGLKSQLEDTKNKFGELQGQLETEKQKFQNEILQRDVNSEYQAGLLQIMPKLGYESDNEKRLALSGFRSEFFNTYQIKPDEDGEFQVIEKASGKVVQGDNLKNKLPSEVVQEFAQNMLKFSNSASKGGAGTKSPKSNGMPAINSIEELDTHLGKQGFVRGSRAWVDERTKLRKELAV